MRATAGNLMYCLGHIFDFTFEGATTSQACARSEDHA
jgi:hypothetical protein